MSCHHRLRGLSPSRTLYSCPPLRTLYSFPHRRTSCSCPLSRTSYMCPHPRTSCSCPLSRTWRNGRRKGLKIPWGKPCAGSSPAVRTSKITAQLSFARLAVTDDDSDADQPFASLGDRRADRARNPVVFVWPGGVENR